jgi:hypothetical protein
LLFRGWLLGLFSTRVALGLLGLRLLWVPIAPTLLILLMPGLLGGLLVVLEPLAGLLELLGRL